MSAALGPTNRSQPFQSGGTGSGGTLDGLEKLSSDFTDQPSPRNESHRSSISTAGGGGNSGDRRPGTFMQHEVVPYTQRDTHLPRMHLCQSKSAKNGWITISMGPLRPSL